MDDDEFEEPVSKVHTVTYAITEQINEISCSRTIKILYIVLCLETIETQRKPLILITASSCSGSTNEREKENFILDLR